MICQNPKRRGSFFLRSIASYICPMQPCCACFHAIQIKLCRIQREIGAIIMLQIQIWRNLIWKHFWVMRLHMELIEVSYLKLLLSRSLFWIPNIWLDAFVRWFFILIRALRCLNQLYLAFRGVDLIFWLSSQGDLEAQDPSFIGCATIFFQSWVRLVRSKGSHHNLFQIDNHAFKFKFHY